MLDLKTCDYPDIASFARELYEHYINNPFSFEEIAQSCTDEIFSSFTNTYGQPNFALVRIYRYGHRDELLPELQSLVDDDCDYCLALMGTTGIERKWCHRTLSKSHQIFCASSADIMVQEAFRTVGFDWTNPQIRNAAEPNYPRWSMQPFLIADAPGSDIIREKREFVRPYRVKSVIGIGGQLANDAGVMLLAFSTVPLNDHDLDKFSEITPYVLTALANYNRPDTLWRERESA